MQKLKNFNPKNYTAEEKWQLYLWRGVTFWTGCVRKLNKENRTWVGVVDTDEYFAFNQHWDNVNKTKIPKHMGNQNETVAHWIASGNDPLYSQECQCFKTARIHFAANATDPETVGKDLPPRFEAKYFHTINNRLHVPDINVKDNGKVILNVKYYTWKRFVNPHRPFKECLPDATRASAHNNLTSIHTHHYTGTLETFYRPGDPFRTYENFVRRNTFWWGLNQYDDSMKPWLKEFVKLVGRDNALQLTQIPRQEAYLEDKEIRERLERGEKVEAVYEWK